MFKDKMDVEAIPERVYILCKHVSKNPLSVSELREKMEPQFVGNSDSLGNFGHYRMAAEELGLISISDNTVSLAVDEKVVKDISCMRKYINSNMENLQKSLFYDVTRECFEMGKEVFQTDKSIVSMAPFLQEKIGRQVDDVSMRAWRFWVSFLGFGYIQNMIFLPNAMEFIKDQIQQSSLEKKERYSITEFIDAIRPGANIILPSNPQSRVLNYGVSNGLRALHDAGIITLEHILDQSDSWVMFPLKTHSITETITNIVINK